MKRLSYILICGCILLILLAGTRAHTQCCSGDINCDGSVDGRDLSIMARKFGSTGCGASVSIRSAYAEFAGTEQKILMTVPANKRFIITDITSASTQNDGGFILLENNAVKFKMTFNVYKNDTQTRSFHFYSGIPFDSGTNIRIESSKTSIMIAGYEIDD